MFLEILWNAWNFAAVKHLTDKLHVRIKCQAQWFLILLFAFNLMMRILKSQCLQWNLIDISQVKSSLKITSKSFLSPDPDQTYQATPGLPWFLAPLALSPTNVNSLSGVTKFLWICCCCDQWTILGIVYSCRSYHCWSV